MYGGGSCRLYFNSSPFSAFVRYALKRTYRVAAYQSISMFICRETVNMSYDRQKMTAKKRSHQCPLGAYILKPIRNEIQKNG